MIEENLRETGNRRIASPVSLELGTEDHRRDRYRSSLDHALDPHLVCLDADSAGRVSDEVHVVAIAQRVDHRERQTDLPKFFRGELPMFAVDAENLVTVSARRINQEDAS
jgi:hypothetical protein